MKFANEAVDDRLGDAAVAMALRLADVAHRDGAGLVAPRMFGLLDTAFLGGRNQLLTFLRKKGLMNIFRGNKLVTSHFECLWEE